MTDNKEIMAKNILRNMEKMGVNATEVCKALCIKQNTFSDWVNARTYPRIDKIELMARYFGVLKSDLVEDKESTDFILSEEEKVVVSVMRKSNSYRDRLASYAQFIDGKDKGAPDAY